MMEQPGSLLRHAIATEQPLQIVGTINAYCALLAQQSNFKALYLSGAGLANANFALPDLGLTSLPDVVEQVQRITSTTGLPLLVDLDTGWGSPLNVRRAFKEVSRAYAAGAHIEDQTEGKRCGHREGKHLVSISHMAGRIKAATDGRCDDAFLVMARTDALSVEGLEKTRDRALAYEAAGADAIFLEAATSLEDYASITKELQIPVLANLTEFGKTPAFSLEELNSAGVKMALYPLSAFRAMNAAALKVYRAIKNQGGVREELPNMQNREALYQCLEYESFEKAIDDYLALMESDNE